MKTIIKGALFALATSVLVSPAMAVPVVTVPDQSYTFTAAFGAGSPYAALNGTATFNPNTNVYDAFALNVNGTSFNLTNTTNSSGNIQSNPFGAQYGVNSFSLTAYENFTKTALVGTSFNYGFSPTAYYSATSLIFSPALAPAVPEPATWAMMILGMGAVGFAMRSAKRRSEEKFETKIKTITYGAVA